MYIHPRLQHTDPGSPDNKLKLESEILGLFRQVSVRGFTVIVLMICSLRLMFTLFPYRAMRILAYWGRTRNITIVLVFVTGAVFLTLAQKIDLKDGLRMSSCMGLLMCEVSREIDHPGAAKLAVVVVSLAVSLSILTAIIVTWAIANKSNKKAKNILILRGNKCSKNFKAVKTSLSMCGIFLICNAGPITNNILILVLAAGSTAGPAITKLYFIADVLEQWVLPIITVANSVLYTATNKKLKNFSVRYYKMKCGSAVAERAAGSRSDFAVRYNDLRTRLHDV